MKIGDTVYTINNKTNNIDSWTFGGLLRTPKEILAYLAKGRKYCYLPLRCVFETEAEAKTIIERYK